MALLKSFNHWLFRLIGLVAMISLLAQVFLMSLKAILGIASRGEPPGWYAWLREAFGWGVFEHPPTWMTEISISLMIWVGFLGAALAIRTRAHLGIRVAVLALPKPAQRVIDAWMWLLVACFCALFGVISARYLALALELGETVPGTAGFAGFWGLASPQDSGFWHFLMAPTGHLLRAPFYTGLVLFGGAGALFAFEHYLGTMTGQEAISERPA